MVLTVGDDVWGAVFRIQCAFPNMEGVAMLNKNNNKIEKKSWKKIGMVGDDVERGGILFSGSCLYFKIWKEELSQKRHCNKIGGKSEENRDDGQYC